MCRKKDRRTDYKTPKRTEKEAIKNIHPRMNGVVMCFITLNGLLSH